MIIEDKLQLVVMACIVILLLFAMFGCEPEPEMPISWEACEKNTITFCNSKFLPDQIENHFSCEDEILDWLACVDRHIQVCYE